jgi:tetratricopeptide (TPR) repeat protein
MLLVTVNYSFTIDIDKDNYFSGEGFPDFLDNMDRSIRSRTSSTSSVRSPAAPSTPAPTPTFSTAGARTGHRAPSPDQLAASLSRLRAERALSIPATPAPTPNPSNPYPHHTLHPDAILDSLSNLGGDEGIASSSIPSTPAPTPFSPSPSVNQHIDPTQIAASIARLREEGVGSVEFCTQPTTPSTTPAYPPYPGQPPAHNLGVIPEHLAEGINSLGRGQDEGLDSGSNPCTPTPTPFSPSPAQHSVLAEQLAAGINRLRVEEGMSSGGSTGMPATPAPTPFSHGPGGIKPEDLAASISRLSVIQEADAGPSINILDATGSSTGNNPISPNPGNNLSNYFGTPQSSGDSIFDHLTTPSGKGSRSRSGSEAGSGFHDVTIHTPARHANQSSTPLMPQSPSAQHAPINPHNVTPNPPLFSTPNTTANPTDLLSPASTISTYATPAAPTPTETSQFPTTPLAPPPTGSRASTELFSSTPSNPKPVPEIFSPAQFISTPLPNHQTANLNPNPASTNPRPESPANRNPTSEDLLSFAWIPSPACREVLASMATTPGTFYPSREQLTLPGVAPGSEQGDPVRDTVAKYQGEGEAAKRQILTSDGVTADTRGLQQLLAAGNYRAAVNHTAQLLEMYGQGKGKAGQLSKHSQTSLQLWWVRLALLVKLRQFSVAEAEAAAFGDLDSPDLFYQYYPELYPNRRGSIVPWSLRLLLAELPMYNNRQVPAMNKLFQLMRTVRKMIDNLEKGLQPDGDVDLETDDGTRSDRSSAISCWKGRERQILYSLINCSIFHHDYESAVKCLDMLQEKELEENVPSLYAAYGRLYLQLGNLLLADQFFNKAALARDNSPASQVEGMVDSAFLAIGQGQFQAALDRFQAAESLASGKQAKAISNNIAVCLLYVGKLKEGLARLETSITQDPTNIQVSI